MQLLSTIVSVIVEAPQGKHTRKQFMQNIRSSHSITTNNTNARKDNEQHDVSVWTEQFSSSVQLSESSIYTVAEVCSFLASWATTRAVKTPRVCSPYYVKVMWPCVMQQWVAGVSARLVNKQSVQTHRGNSPVLTVISLQVQERRVPALTQPDNKGGLHAQIFS